MRIVLNGRSPLEVDPRDPDRLEVAVGPGPVSEEVLKAAEAILPNDEARGLFRLMVMARTALPPQRLAGEEAYRSLAEELLKGKGGPPAFILAREYLARQGAGTPDRVAAVFATTLEEHPGWATSLEEERRVRTRLYKALMEEGYDAGKVVELANTLLALVHHVRD
uniref:Uncharacterized protein n=1 Tax=Thermus caliditerrae TaxID=1330700 RepID=A0A7C5REY7_9DEIN